MPTSCGATCASRTAANGLRLATHHQLLSVPLDAHELSFVHQSGAGNGCQWHSCDTTLFGCINERGSKHYTNQGSNQTIESSPTITNGL